MKRPLFIVLLILTNNIPICHAHFTKDLFSTYTTNHILGDSQNKYSILARQTITSFDFTYKQNVCNPFSVQFFNVGVNTLNPYWSFGDGAVSTGNLNPVHTYSAAGNYTVKYSVQNGGPPDTISKIIIVDIVAANIIITPDTTICFGTTTQLHTTPASLSFCWSPTTYLNDPNSPDPVTSAIQNITYHFNAEVAGANLISNGDFTAGNTGFTSQYNFANPNMTEGEYFVGTSPQAWNRSLSNCSDHTGNGNMLLVNGAPAVDVNVWKQTITVTPNTNYAFSTWIQALWPPNPAQLQFSINGSNLGNLITASLPTCTWTQFYTTWNSGSVTSAIISIVNKNTAVLGNDFALDDISFAPVSIRRDSIKITVDHPVVKTNFDTTVCTDSQILLNATGAFGYTWTPATGLSNAGIANPVATIHNPITYYVTGFTANGCAAKDTLAISTFNRPNIVTTPNASICHDTNIQLFTSGGVSYLWSSALTLNDPNIFNPIARPVSNTTYFVTITDSHTCVYKDSVNITLKPIPIFSISKPQSVCENDSRQLLASGGTSYLWQPSTFLDNPNISDPIAIPHATTTYFVNIKDNTCNDSTTLTTTLTIKKLPIIKATSSNDIDCSNSFTQLKATGARQYVWTPGGNLNDSIVANPIATPKSTTLFVVKGVDINGCKNYDTVSVIVGTGNKSGYFMPNAFTPNGDNLNDCFRIKSWGLIEVDFSIYDRFGERVFHTTNPLQCWNGLYKGTSLSGNVFVYVIKGKTNCEVVNKKGYLVLIK